ncbi:MAG: site-specific integrase, partial [Candidatus Marinimicrobia bacterium]|nr:site-specific integrase [Candidatus Neomarinimicrobiota bacterium]
MLKIVQDFVNYLKIERNLADNTVDAYRNDLERYSQFLLDRQISNPKLVSLSDIQDFINCL